MTAHLVELLTGENHGRAHRENLLLRKLRITVDSRVIEAHLLDGPTADVIFDALPFETEGAVVDVGILISSPIYAPMEDGARSELMTGEIGFSTMD